MRHSNRDRTQAGFSYMEVVVTALLIALILVPALESLRIGVVGGDAHLEFDQRQRALASKMEEVLAQPYGILEGEAKRTGGAPAVFSDPAPAPNRRVVGLIELDVDNADGDGDFRTGVDPGLLWVTVRFEGELDGLTSFASRP